MKVLRVFCALSFFLCGHHAAADNTTALSVYMNKMVDTLMPFLSGALQAGLPSSYGNCDGAPEPCRCNGDKCDYLYYKHKSWEYKVMAKWVGGLNTLNTSVVTFSPYQDGKLVFSVGGGFAKLPVSIYIGECITFDDCKVLWDNTDGCCGENINFNVALSFGCQTKPPYLTSVDLLSVDIDPLVLHESILHLVRFKLMDLTDDVKDMVQGVIRQYLQKEAFIPWPPGDDTAQKYSVAGLLNYFAEMQTSGAEVLCQ